ncbi:hypothetical protein [Humibacter sp.]|uniref:hypothetical protein n=1 Tax=Humibacter sp. TaxID=1940291 RepID=UPI002C6170FB|nr:hypothetical protein [Humibacter sp.]HVX09208.1 hypothetical protein [Humibacter sp.]
MRRRPGLLLLFAWLTGAVFGAAFANDWPPLACVGSFLLMWAVCGYALIVADDRLYREAVSNDARRDVLPGR